MTARTSRAALTGIALLLAEVCRAQTPALELPLFHLGAGEWKGSVMTESGHRITADVARSAALGPVILFDINGWADMAATPEGQRRVANARAAAVREELIRNGVAEGDIGLLVADRPDGAVPPLPPEAAKRVVIVVYY